MCFSLFIVVSRALNTIIEHPAKAFAPIEEIPSGMETDARLVQKENLCNVLHISGQNLNNPYHLWWKIELTKLQILIIHINFKKIQVEVLSLNGYVSVFIFVFQLYSR